jgi:hypothetical protein
MALTTTAFEPAADAPSSPARDPACRHPGGRADRSAHAIKTAKHECIARAQDFGVAVLIDAASAVRAASDTFGVRLSSS